MKQSTALAKLASDLVQALPAHETDLRLYIGDIGLYHLVILSQYQLSPKPENFPYYGATFAAALQAVEMGWENRVDYHFDRLAKELQKAGGALVPVKRSPRPIVTPPQPNRRKDRDNGRVPRDGRE